MATRTKKVVVPQPYAYIPRGGHVECVNGTSGAVYRVEPMRCDCPAFKYGRRPCKHMIRARDLGLFKQPEVKPLSVFTKATKTQSKLRLALIGPAGSGKTYTALAVATSLGKRVAVIDTEHGSASKYADLFAFDTLILESFHPQKYVEGIQAAESAGYDVVLIDSLSHAWVGKDGGLELHDRAVARQKTANKFTAWAEVTPHHNALIEALLQSKCHLIATMRSKTEYVLDERNKPRKVGMAPVMRDGVEYEFDVVGDLDADNTLYVTKTRCPSLAGASIPKPGRPFADTLRAWLSDGATPAQHASPRQPLGAPSAAKSNPLPKDGVELFARLKDYESKLVAAGLCQPRELTGYVEDQGEKKLFPKSMEDWKGEQIKQAVQWAKDCEASLQRRVATRKPEALGVK